ncbi:MAG: hypothetical protein WDO74_24955 [Pseudomonadota bacterium]
MVSSALSLSAPTRLSSIVSPSHLASPPCTRTLTLVPARGSSSQKSYFKRRPKARTND